VTSERPIVAHISETALWVAALRARESRRPDALFCDPLAQRFLGDRGEGLASALSGPTTTDWAIIVRTKLIDDLVMRSLAEGADRVVNLAAGLDTRPYRLPVPSALTWIEADLPAMIEQKEAMLAGENSRCRVVREKVDLADRAPRQAFLERALDGARRALVITEGLLIYLEPAQVAEIAVDLAGDPRIAWWMLDLTSPRIVQLFRERVGAKLGEAAAMKFAPPQGVAFFRKHGWVAHDIESYLAAAARWGRGPWWIRLSGRFPGANPESPGKRRWAAIVRLMRPA
jgi:methyltransferase (TIGR00027 family)